MKEFEKWCLKKYPLEERWIYGTKSNMFLNKAARRAALEEVLRQVEINNRVNFIVAKDCSIVDWIKKELQDGSS